MSTAPHTYDDLTHEEMKLDDNSIEYNTEIKEKGTPHRKTY